MAGNGNHPLNQSHFDEVTLQEYVLGQLLPDKEEAIRRHVAVCPTCRAELADIQAFCQQISAELDRKLDRAKPDSPLSFDRIANEWRSPPRRVILPFRARLLPSLTSCLLFGLLVLSFLLLFFSGDSATLRHLELTDHYNGPTAMVAAATKDGLVILRLSKDSTGSVMSLSSIIDPHNLQFSPDGRWLALRDGLTLHLIETRRSGAHLQLAVNEAAEWSWSPDSHRLAYTDGGGQLAVFDVVFQTDQVLVPARDYAWGAPVWTADGQQIAYASAFPLPISGDPLLRQSLWRVNTASGYRVELAENPDPAHRLLVPAAWSNSETALLAWDASAGPAGNQVDLYRVDTGAHGIEPLEEHSLSQGTRLIWPNSGQGISLVTHRDRLATLNLDDGTSQNIPGTIPWPQNAEWSPNGTWIAYTEPGAAEGEGLFLLAVKNGELRPLHLSAGATEKAVSWAGSENLFVLRQRQDNSAVELWLVPLTTGQPPQRIMTNVRLPGANLHLTWQWNDVLAVQVISPEN